jgi:hypothetical protein
MIIRPQVLYIPAAEIDIGLQLSSTLFEQLVQRTLTSLHQRTIHGHPPPSPVKLSKTPIRVNPLAFSVCGTCTILAMQQTSLNIFTDGATWNSSKNGLHLLKRRPNGLFSVYINPLCWRHCTTSCPGCYRRWGLISEKACG